MGQSKKIFTHIHHIIPRSLGGSNNQNNLVKLTISGHAAVHKWMYEEYGRWQDKIAWLALSGMIGKEEIIRMKLSLAHKGIKVKRTKEHQEALNISVCKAMKRPEIRKKISDNAKERYKDKTNHPMYNIKHTEKSKKQITKTRIIKGLSTKVEMYDKNNILLKSFDSMKQAADYIGVRYSTIPESIQRNYYVRKKYKFVRITHTNKQYKTGR